MAGICRSNGGSLQKCYNKGRILGKKWGGGICAENLIDGEIKYCYNEGWIGEPEENEKTNWEISKIGFMAGICGENAGLVYSCYNIGNVTADSNVYGICYNVQDINAQDGKIYECKQSCSILYCKCVSAE